MEAQLTLTEIESNKRETLKINLADIILKDAQYWAQRAKQN